MKNCLTKAALPVPRWLFFTIFFQIIFYGLLSAQPSSSIEGVIKALNKNEPLEGVNVLVKNTTIGTTTGRDGKFRITSPGNIDTLVISSVGYVTKEIVVRGQANIEIDLVEQSKSLEGVVIVGYTSQRKKDLTSAVGIADVESMQKRSVTDVAQALQGNVAGVNIAAGNGNPGSVMHINIRGISSFSGDNTPLVIVDGVQIEGGLRELNVNDIQSIQVLKDASSAAIYGSRAANGVILVTTKRGDKRSERAKITYQNYFGVQEPYKGIALTNSSEYVQLLQRMYGDDLSGDPLVPEVAKDYLSNPSNFKDYDWQNEIYTTAPMQSHDISVSGGGQSGTFRISAGYVDQRGITLSTGYKRANVRANSQFFVGDKITIGQSISFSKSTTNMNHLHSAGRFIRRL